MNDQFFRFSPTPTHLLGVACALMWLGSASVASPSQQQQQAEENRALQFGANVEIVLIDLTVTDSDGHFVHGLTADDFRIFEEDEEMQISFFALEKFAAESMKTGDPKIDELPALSRYIVVYIDGMNTTPQDWLRLRPHLEAWLKEGLQPNDYVLLASLHPDGRMRLTPEFTRDPVTLVNALMKVEGNRDLAFRVSRQERELADALGLEAFAGIGDVTADAARLRQGAQLARTFEQQRRNEVRFALDYLNGLADHLGVAFQVPGPKVVVMVSGGLPEIPGLNFRLIVDQQASEVSPQVRQLAGLSTFQPLIPEQASDPGAGLQLIQAIGRFNRENYLFYTIDATALAGSETGDARYSFGTNLSPTSKASVASNEQFGLMRIADGTGGLPFFNSSNFPGALERVQEDTAFRYVLGYQLPSHDPIDIEEGKVFRVEVEATVPGVTIRAREGYVDSGS